MSRFRSSSAAVFVQLLAVGALAASSVHAAAEGSAVVAKVGDYSVTRDDIEFRLRALPAYQRAAMGLSDAELGRKVLEEGLLYDEMLAQEARRRDAAKDPRTQWQVRRAQANAALVALKKTVPEVVPADVAAYYEAHRLDFDTPERVQVWRLLVDSESSAKELIQGLGKSSTAEQWGRLVLDKSIDQATRMRSGNLGFLLPNGHSNEAGLVVDPAVYKAALTVKDGEWVPAPVKEGEHWAVVWRRGSLHAQKRTLDEARAQITSTLGREREESARKSELARLRSVSPVETHPDLLALIVIAPPLP